MSSEELPPLSDMGMMYVSGHLLLSLSWLKTSTRKFAAVPPEKTQMPGACPAELSILLTLCRLREWMRPKRHVRRLDTVYREMVDSNLWEHGLGWHDRAEVASTGESFKIALSPSSYVASWRFEM